MELREVRQKAAEGPTETGGEPATDRIDHRMMRSDIRGSEVTSSPERPNTVAGLIEKHREIAGKIEHTRRVLNALVFDLEALEHAIRLFDPNAELGRAKPLPSEHAAFKGEMRRDVLAALRAAQGPLTSLDIARQVITRRKLPDDAKIVSMMRKRVGAALWKLRARGIVVEVAQVGDYKGWRLNPTQG